MLSNLLEKLKVYKLVNSSCSVFLRSSYFYSLIISTGVVSFLAFSIPIDWLEKFLRVGDLSVYRVVFWVMVLIFFVFLRGYLIDRNYIVSMIIACAIGFVSSFFAVIGMSIMSSDGVERMQNSWSNLGVMSFFSGGVYISLISLGWLTAISIAICLRVIYKNTS